MKARRKKKKEVRAFHRRRSDKEYRWRALSRLWGLPAKGLVPRRRLGGLAIHAAVGVRRIVAVVHAAGVAIDDCVETIVGHAATRPPSPTWCHHLRMSAAAALLTNLVRVARNVGRRHWDGRRCLRCCRDNRSAGKAGQGGQAQR